MATDGWEAAIRTAAIIRDLNTQAWFRELCERERKAAMPATPERDPVRSISIKDVEALNQNLEDVAAGRIAVVDPEQKPRQLGENEIAAEDQEALNNNIQRIARGELQVRF